DEVTGRRPRPRFDVPERADGARLGEVARGPEDLLAQLAVAGKLRRVDADVLDLRGLQAALLDRLELLVARVDHLIGLLRVDDRDDRHVAVADDEADVLVRDL